jgi:hypothetical protein
MTFGGSRDEHPGRPFGADIVRMANGLIRLIDNARVRTRGGSPKTAP